MTRSGTEKDKTDDQSSTLGQHAKPLRTSVQTALETYFADLNGHAPGDLYRMVINEVERPLFETVMLHARGNQTKAAEILGLNRSTLRKKLKQYGLE